MEFFGFKFLHFCVSKITFQRNDAEHFRWMAYTSARAPTPTSALVINESNRIVLSVTLHPCISLRHSHKWHLKRSKAMRERERKTYGRNKIKNCNQLNVCWINYWRAHEPRSQFAQPLWHMGMTTISWRFFVFVVLLLLLFCVSPFSSLFWRFKIQFIVCNHS